MKNKYPQLAGDLFEKVQLGSIFDDPKTFVDSIPRTKTHELIKKYQSQKENAEFDLDKFIKQNFIISKYVKPRHSYSTSVNPINTVEDYIEDLWGVLYKKAKRKMKRPSSYIPLPYPTVVAGGRFREMYYWDSYFTCLGLIHSKKTKLVLNICKNFSYMIDNYGFIPNGNRLYFLTRSQPPVFAMLIDLIAPHIKNKTLFELVLSLEKEYQFWMKGKYELDAENPEYKRVVKFEDKTVLNRYYDNKETPREESYTYDFLMAAKFETEQEKKDFYRNIRAAAESGWDFSSRWLEDPEDLSTIKTTRIIPVDLNCLIYNMEMTLSKWFEYFNNSKKSSDFLKRAERRKDAINKYFWNEEKGFYFDYSLDKKEQTETWSLAGVYPLYFGIASSEQAEKININVKEKFLKDGGLVTTLTPTTQQWDSPNGWAPLQWFAAKGLEKYLYMDTASEVKKRWTNLCEIQYKNNGALFEKYNVVDTAFIADGGEYKVQEGFGWTNGVYLDFMKEI